jgi:hypothetical protein
MKSYLDELAMNPDPTSEETKSQAKAKGPGEWFPHSVDFAGDLQIAWKLWDAVSSIMHTLDVVEALNLADWIPCPL